MKATIKYSLFLLLLVIASACGSGSTDQKPPENAAPFIPAPGQTDSNLQFARLEYQFGVVKKGTLVEHKYEYKNISAVPVKIIQVHVSCPCMTAEYTQDFIQPGERGFVKCSFDTKDQHAAKYEKIFAVQVSNQQKIPSLYMKGSIVE